MADQDISEIYIQGIGHTIVNIYKLLYEEMGYDLGDTQNEIEYRNYLIEDPIKFTKPFTADELSTGDGPSPNVTTDLTDPSLANASMGNLTVEKLAPIFKGCKKPYLGACLSALNKYGAKVGLNDKGKLYVLAQFAHESGNFIYTAELGKGKGRKYGAPMGPYGKVYYGRGPIQVTWDYNYKAITEKYFPSIGINADIYKDPDLCERDLEIGCAASLCWFMMPGNGKRAIAAANNGDIKGLSKAINGGFNGLQDRIEKTKKILQIAGS